MHYAGASEEQEYPVGGSVTATRVDSTNERVIGEPGLGNTQHPADGLATNDCPASLLRQGATDQEDQSRVPSGHGWGCRATPVTPTTSPPSHTQQSQELSHAAELGSGPSPGHAPSRSSRPHTPRGVFTESRWGIASTSSMTDTSGASAGDRLLPAESAGVSGSPPQHPPQSGGQGSGPTQGSQLQVARYNRRNDDNMEIDEIESTGPSETPHPPFSAPPNSSCPQHGHGGPASPGPSNDGRRQRNQSQDKLLVDLGEGVKRMNSNLAALNSNLSALNDFVKDSHGSQSKRKGKGRETETRRNDDEGTDADADDEEPVVQGYRPPKRKTQKQNILHVRPFPVWRVLVTLTIL